MYSFFVGIDVSKYFFNACAFVDEQPQDIGQFSNDHDGFVKLVDVLDKVTDCSKVDWFICFENTGSYSKTLLEWLASQQIPCREENALLISRSMGFRRGKDDKIDARDICLYAFRHRDSIKPTELTKTGIKRLKKLLSRRTFLMRQRHACKLSLKDQRLEMEPEIFLQLNEQNQQLISMYEEQISAAEQLIEQTIYEDSELKKNNQLAQSVKGIGPITSAFLIAYTHNFERFDNARQFACYSGIAPFPNRSGVTIRGKTKVSPMANKQIKAILSNGANSAIVFDKELKLYYQRKRAEGKAYGTVINAVKNKLVQRVFAVIKRQTPFVPMMNYA